VRGNAQRCPWPARRVSLEGWRRQRAVLPFLPRADQRFWTDRFPLLASEAITPVTNMVDRLRRSSRVTALLGQSQSTYRVREAMDNQEPLVDRQRSERREARTTPTDRERYRHPA
jgi:hypothetical protein